MCLGVPGRVISMVDGSGGQLAVVNLAGSRRRVNVGMLESPPDPGDWLVIHVGFALERMDDATARDALACFDLPQLQETPEERSK